MSRSTAAATCGFWGGGWWAVGIDGAATNVLSLGSRIESVEARAVVTRQLQQGGLTVELGVEMLPR